jgi:hypothetical protein
MITIVKFEKSDLGLGQFDDLNHKKGLLLYIVEFIETFVGIVWSGCTRRFRGLLGKNRYLVRKLKWFRKW